jgi:transcriptional regulator with XRE-family HTH domain
MPDGDIAIVRISQSADLGALIRARRRSLRWSQAHLAGLAQVGRQWLVEFEQGKSGAPIDLVIRALAALGYALHLSNETPVGIGIGIELASSQHGAPPSAKGDRPNRRNEAVVTRHVPVSVNSDNRPVERLDSTVEPSPGDYRIATFETIGIAASSGQLYDLENRPSLDRMVTHVIAVEGPIFVDLIARRIARAHRLSRATRKLIVTIQEITEGRFARTREDARAIVWPERAETSVLLPFRPASLDIRDHADVPLIELASLATPLLTEGHNSEAAATIMGRQLGLELIRPKTRSRLTMAVELAKQHRPGAENGHSD